MKLKFNQRHLAETMQKQQRVWEWAREKKRNK